MKSDKCGVRQCHYTWLAVITLCFLSFGSTFARVLEEGEYLPYSMHFYMGMKDGVSTEGEYATDGVELQIFMQEKEKEDIELIYNITYSELGWTEVEVDLSDYESKVVNLILKVNAGPEKNSNFDWFLMGEPEIKTYQDVLYKLDDLPFKIQTTVIVGKKTTTLERLEFGGLADKGSFTSADEPKMGFYIHPPYRNVFGYTVMTFEGLNISSKPKACQGNECHEEL